MTAPDPNRSADFSYRSHSISRQESASGGHLKVSLYANRCDMETEQLPQLLHEPLDRIGDELSNDYGGTMEHLWIEFQLVDNCGPFSFRFQKKVGGKTPDRLTGIVPGTYENVGHYSVLPDIAELLYVPRDSVIDYVLQSLCRSTIVLIDKQKRLGGFDAERFRADFLAACKRHGYDMDSQIGWD